ncbi:hypothetical protein PHMEG_00013171 [Phytophthora megakarya]|uniref:Uncharacterized protein n=1 Tax=Phytophthora megakarya TaxID=4795 RepID=A0A225W7W9_9STRA|nr:hypothetical protein PHMEG_00013171 [Phytophthora megakarya]
MVRTTRPATTFTNAQISAFYFRPCRDEYDEVILDYYRCRCGTVRKQTNRNDFHMPRQHPDHEAAILDTTTAETVSVVNFVRHSSQNLFTWLDWIVGSNIPLAFCESRAAIRYTNLQPISSESLRACMGGVMQAVERKIAAELPSRFSIMFDGWTHASEHYVAWFACYKNNGVFVTPLPSMTPLMNEEDDDMSARTHLQSLATMLLRDFGVQAGPCRFLVGDNCSVNRLFATVLGVPLVGCASHQLNRAIRQDMAQHEDDLAAVQALMIKLRTLTQSAKLRLKTELRPVIRQDTRWSSTFAMVQRYLKLQMLKTTTSWR